LKINITNFKQIRSIWIRHKSLEETAGNCKLLCKANTRTGKPHSLDRLALRGGDASCSSSLPLPLPLPLPDSESLKTFIRQVFVNFENKIVITAHAWKMGFRR
jgi:hypothetical protein